MIKSPAIILAVAAALVAVAPASAASTTLDFSTLPMGIYNGNIVFPEATFVSSTGEFYVGAAGIAYEICPLTPAFTCSASMTVNFTAAVNNLSFIGSAYDTPGSSVFVAGIANGTPFVTSFTDTSFNDLSAFSGITTITVTNDDAAGLGYDFFTFDIAAVPEPASWAMMIGGFALAGAAMRRRSVKLAYA